MNSVKTIKLKDGTEIFVEMGSVDEDFVEANTPSRDLGLPEGATPTAVADKMLNAVEKLQSTLTGVISIVHQSLKDNAPSEWGVELNIGFKGKTNPIPIILSGEANASLKVHAKWKRADLE